VAQFHHQIWAFGWTLCTLHIFSHSSPWTKCPADLKSIRVFKDHFICPWNYLSRYLVINELTKCISSQCHSAENIHGNLSVPGRIVHLVLTEPRSSPVGKREPFQDGRRESYWSAKQRAGQMFQAHAFKLKLHSLHGQIDANVTQVHPSSDAQAPVAPHSRCIHFNTDSWEKT